MAEDQSKEEEKFDFTTEGEVIGYISLDQARLRVMQVAGEVAGEYGRRYRNVAMAFEVVEAIEAEDSYTITLSFRPQGDFAGTPGQEQFFVEKEGRIAVRQVLSLPKLTEGQRFHLLPVTLGLLAVGVVVAIVAVFALGGTSDDSAAADALIEATRVTSSNSLAAAANNAPVAVDDASNVANGGTEEIEVIDKDVDGDALNVVSVTDNARAYTYYTNGMNHYDDKNYEQAIREFTNALRLNPDHKESFSLRSSSYLESGQLQESLQDANEAARLDPGFAKALQRRCATYSALGELQKALDDCTRAIQLDANECCAHYIRAHIYASLGENKNAIQDFDKAIRLDPLYAAAYDGRGESYRSLGQYMKADDDKAKACSLDSYFCKMPADTTTPPTNMATPVPAVVGQPTAAPMSESSFPGTHGTIIANDMETFDIGSGRLQWSSSGTQTGYFYTGAQTTSDRSYPVLVAGVTPASDCGKMPGRPPGLTQGYTGLSDINDLTDASSLIYTRAPSDNNSEGAVYFGTKVVEGCENEGMLVFSQAGRYGVLDFVVIDDSIPWSQATPWTITINWWLGFPGITDFSQAPDNP